MYSHMDYMILREASEKWGIPPGRSIIIVLKVVFPELKKWDGFG